MEMVKIVPFCLTLILFCGCDFKQESLKSEALQKEIASRKIKKISEGDILDLASKLGGEIATLAQKTLGGQLKKSMQEGGASEAINFCNVNAYPLLDTFRSSYDVGIRRVSLRIRNPMDAPNEIESQILEAYQYNIENDLPLDDNLQEIGDTVILFSRAIVLNNGLCLNCHGDIENEINPEVRGIITRLYPNDNATGHSLGDLRGMWSITFRKKDLVLNL
jgi:Protein of unknown function (DUF3365)